jgi:hypothetical protein
MARLVLNIVNHGSTIRFADAESSVSLLPGKSSSFRPFLFQPTGRVGFDHAQAIGNRQFCGKTRQEMYMIGGSTDRDGRCAQFTQNPPDIGMNIGANGVSEKWNAVGGGKDDVRKQISECVRHSYAPSGGYCSILTFVPQAHAWGYHLLPASRAGNYSPSCECSAQSQKTAKASSRFHGPHAIRNFSSLRSTNSQPFVESGQTYFRSPPRPISIDGEIGLPSSM